MGSQVFFMVKSRRLAFAGLSCFFMLMFVGFIILVGPINEHFGIEDVLQGINVIFLIFLCSALYFIFKTKIPLIKFDDHAFSYNSLILKEGIRSGGLFPLFPYLYTSLNSTKRYAELVKTERRNEGFFIYKKQDSFGSRNPMLLQLGAFSKADGDKIIEILNQKII